MRYYEYHFSDKTDNFEFLGPNLPKTEFWGRNFKSLSLDLESASLRYYVHQFSDKADNFEFLGPSLTKNRFWCQNFKSLSLDLEQQPWATLCTNFQTKQTTLNFWAKICPKVDFEVETPPIEHACQFSVKMDNFFWTKFGEIAQLRAIF